MKNLGRLAFLAGLVVAIVAAFVESNILPWVVGGLGIAVGLFNLKGTEVSRGLWAATGLVVALSAILLQTFNPAWLNDIVFFIRVFVAHVLLSLSFVYFFKTAGD